jgi:hypothetical protein
MSRLRTFRSRNEVAAWIFGWNHTFAWIMSDRCGLPTRICSRARELTTLGGDYVALSAPATCFR